jgi:hypothetical protein
MAPNMKEIGNKGGKMALEFTQTQMEKLKRVFGKMEKEKND